LRIANPVPRTSKAIAARQIRQSQPRKECGNFELAWFG